jgi:hypothetical protein
MQPPIPSPGFGHKQLESLSSDESPERILVPAITDLIERSGYIDYEQAVIDIRDAVRELGADSTSPKVGSTMRSKSLLSRNRQP